MKNRQHTLSPLGSSVYTNEKYTPLAKSFGYRKILKFRGKLYKDHCIPDLKKSLLAENGIEQSIGDIIDMGAGDGRKTLWLLDLLPAGRTLYVVEQNKEMMQQAKKRFIGMSQRVEFIEADMFDILSLTDISKHVGLVTYNQVRHHYHEDKLIPHLCMTRDSIQENGCISVLDFCSPEAAKNIKEMIQNKLFEIAIKSYEGMTNRLDYFNNLTYQERQNEYERIGLSVDKKYSQEYKNLLPCKETNILGTAWTTQTITYNRAV